MTAALLSSTPCVGAVEQIAKIGAANSKRRTCAVIFSFLPYALQFGKHSLIRPGGKANLRTALAHADRVRYSAFHGMMTRSSSLRPSVIRKPMIAITNKPTYICSTANVLQALQIK